LARSHRPAMPISSGISEGAGLVKHPVQVFFLFRTRVNVARCAVALGRRDISPRREGAWCGSTTTERAQSHTRVRLPRGVGPMSRGSERKGPTPRRQRPRGGSGAA
jgi:hypothetical protein